MYVCTLNSQGTESYKGRICRRGSPTCIFADAIHTIFSRRWRWIFSRGRGPVAMRPVPRGSRWIIGSCGNVRFFWHWQFQSGFWSLNRGWRLLLDWTGAKPRQWGRRIVFVSFVLNSLFYDHRRLEPGGGHFARRLLLLLNMLVMLNVLLLEKLILFFLGLNGQCRLEGSLPAPTFVIVEHVGGSNAGSRHLSQRSSARMWDGGQVHSVSSRGLWLASSLSSLPYVQFTIGSIVRIHKSSRSAV